MESANLIITEHNINLIISEKNFLNLYKDSFTFIPIIVVNELYDYDKITSQKFNCISLDNITNLSRILHKHMHLSDALENSKEKIFRELITLGFNIKHNGTKYITESIIFLKFYLKTNNIQDIYSIIAKKYNTTSNNIKSNILKSINYMYYETDFLKLEKYFSLPKDIKPTPKQVILTILKNL